MTVEFESQPNSLGRLVCEAKLRFDTGPLSGMKLGGFMLWRGSDGEIHVTFPRRSGGGTERRYFDELPLIKGDPADARRVKTWILAEYRAKTGGEHVE